MTPGPLNKALVFGRGSSGFCVGILHGVAENLRNSPRYPDPVADGVRLAIAQRTAQYVFVYICRVK